MSSPPVMAASGQVVDPTGKSIEGARACLMVAGREGLCTETDEVGYYLLPDNRALKLRISADGFLPLTLAAVDQSRAIVLDRAASLRLRLLDSASGETIPDGKFTVAYKTGRQVGPLPTNAAGLLIRTLHPGEVVVRAEAEGYEKSQGQTVSLEPGKQHKLVLRLVPEGETSEQQREEKPRSEPPRP